MKVTTLIPTTLNDGTQVPEAQLRGYITRFLVACGGVTVEGKVEGHWINNEGVHFEDTCIKLFVVIEDDQLASLESLVSQIGKELQQEAMYLEIDNKTDVRIIDTK